jgi:hypothetical protein
MRTQHLAKVQAYIASIAHSPEQARELVSALVGVDWDEVMAGKALTPREAKKIIDASDAEALRKLPYQEYLKTRHWTALSAVAKLRAGNRCQICNGTEDLQVHHRTYERLGCERLSDLTVLCKKHHHMAHHPEAVD